MCTIILDDVAAYNPDTFNLSEDPESAEYWFQKIQEMADTAAAKAEASEKDLDSTSKLRAENFKTSCEANLDIIKNPKLSPDYLTIRFLLELNGKALRLCNFKDPWAKEKYEETEASLHNFQSRLKKIDQLEGDARWIELIYGVLAGNIFDWGAKAVVDILENNRSFDFHDALEKIQKRPWLVDGLNAWLKRMEDKAHKCAVIFVDNSGADIVLGILPFVRELLKRKTKVLLCANTEPALNDVTCNELKEILQKCSVYCTILSNSLKNGQLLVYPNGQMGPCLDMRQLSPELCDAMEKHGTDLLVIEGMGRALYTNLNVKFRCETLKLAVIKSKWLADKMGGTVFNVICKYEY